MNQRKLNNKGFSLVELIIVIAIMAVLIGLLAPQFIKYVQRSKYSTDVKNGQEIATVIQTLIADNKLPQPTSTSTAIEINDQSEVIKKAKDSNLLKELDLGLENLLDTEVQYLSGGQRQCLALIMATLNQPKVLLLDEHTAALDPKTSKIIMDKTEEIVKKSEIPTLMITHNLQDAIRYGNRLIMLHNGEIILDIKGKEKEELTQDALMEIFQKKATYSDVM